MLAWLSRRVVKDAWIIVGTWALLAGVLLVVSLTGVGGANLFDRAASGSTSIAGTNSAEGERILETLSGDAVTVTLLVTDIDVSEPDTQQAVADALEEAHADLRALVGEQGVNVIDPFVVPGMLAEEAARQLASADLDGFLILVSVNPNGDEVADPDDEAYAAEVAQIVAQVEARLARIPGELAVVDPAVRGIVSDDALMAAAVNDQVRADLLRGSLVCLPLVLLIMVLVFGGFLAAGMPLIGALAAIACTMGVLYVLSFAADLQAFVINIVAVISLGLAIDYGLLITSRYREELTRSQEAAKSETVGRRRRTGRRDLLITTCLTTTLETAGRTVLFSALTVAACMLGLVLLGPSILHSVGIACLAACLIAVAAALTLVPAVLVLLGRRMLRPPLLQRIPVLAGLQRRLGDVADDRGVFRWIARQVQNMAWVVLVACVVALVVLASPARHLHLLTSTTELLPADSDQRAYLTILNEQYPDAQQDATVIIAATGDRVTEFLNQEVSEGLDGVAGIPRVATAGNYTVAYFDMTDAPSSLAAEQTVASIRALPAPADMWVLGQAASQLDVRESMLAALPWLGGFIVLATFALLFLMTGSLLLPLKALMITLLSLAASLGVLTWVFQEGHLAGLLGFAPIGGVEAYVVVTALGVGFGLAMDYEVFLLGRIREYRDAGADTDTAVAKGLQRSGRIVTFAALIMVVVFLGFVNGELLIVKEIGLALAIVVALDATLVRMLLVPAIMTLLGDWNWWAPEPLLRLYERYGLQAAALRPEASVPEQVRRSEPATQTPDRRRAVVDRVD
ncbi:MMPL family transporter [Actinomyces sp.]|uniref:MMPL family transporter n=1 Tax=Actinomyces sp. TaxID=29317 RepID=UPI0026DD21FB|nr:MMPL family transporter [Actinomyces sp.]MDO4900881.1 MMPL family transporter [Actinomyces sp.]